MKTIKQYKVWILAISVIMVIASIWDYQIDVVLTKLNEIFIVHVFYRFLEIFGEFAFMLFFVLAFGFFFNFGLRRKKSFFKYVQVAFNGIGFVLFSIFEFVGFARYLFPEGGNSHGNVTITMYIFSVLFGVVFAFIVNKLMCRIDDKAYKYYKKVALVGVLYIILLTVLVNVIKMTWARPRFWLVESGEAVFVPWYIINGTGQEKITNAYMSFVSGHTANAFAAMFLSHWSLKNSKKWFSYGMIWGLCVAVSRLFAGQHFLSDTIMSGTIAFGLFLVVTSLFELNKYKEV